MVAVRPSDVESIVLFLHTLRLCDNVILYQIASTFYQRQEK